MPKTLDFSPPPKAVLITGASQRIGRAIALDFAERGWAVAIHYNRAEKAAQTLAAQIESDGGKAVALGADLTQDGQAEGLIPRAIEVLGPLGCLVNNASCFEEDTPATATRESWAVHMETNLHAPFILSRVFADQLAKPYSGNIINLIDQRVWNLTPYFTSYTVSKSGLWTLTQTLAMALAPRIRVNAIGPGPTFPSERQSQKQFDRQWQGTPLKRGTTVEEICEALHFLLATPSLTGQMLALDGGQHLGWAQSDRDYMTEE
ncbi:MAG: SDR family oxidoreductase [Rhodospirillaceae bacterium]|jgi:NAD(P)-dependent dehydrogenase (short-subunit alcohol dehydrogenase family)|nr:SDR family oxidoreductase [Rhodospirillaceae bacterium]MBT5374351.1 SDR family oxidoreductase [Rhodospirillaceae bacterium]MBT5660431.1 SDR family oxidoreductase [Rhodospirillaceae bacterium]MBT5752920.1 SDR family oxidoreductase [Rhodospirillaceae bacterium]